MSHTGNKMLAVAYTKPRRTHKLSITAKAIVDKLNKLTKTKLKKTFSKYINCKIDKQLQISLYILIKNEYDHLNYLNI